DNNIYGYLKPKFNGDTGMNTPPVNDGDNKNIYPLVFGRPADAGANGYIGADWKNYTYTLLMSPEYTNRIRDFENWKKTGITLTEERDRVLYPFVTQVATKLGVPLQDDKMKVLEECLAAIDKLQANQGGG